MTRSVPSSDEFTGAKYEEALEKHRVSVCRSMSAFTCPTPRKGKMILYEMVTVCSLLLSATPICDCEVNGNNRFPMVTTGFYAENTKDFNSKRPRLNFFAGTFESRCCTEEKLNGSGIFDVAATVAANGNDAQKMEALDDTRFVAQESDGWKSSAFGEGFREIVKIFNVCRNKVRGKFGENHSGKSTTWEILERARSIYNCMKITSFRELDDLLKDEVISVTGNLDLVKKIGAENGESSETYETDVLRKNWTNLAWERIKKLFEGRALKFHFVQHSSQGRGRRRDHRMFAMMMMGFMIMASILVPMGFQFLTVLGGKSLLMAKMALIMSAINGLKKIAMSNVGYGLYHAAGPDPYHHDPHHHGFHDKIFSMKPQGQENLPFNLVI